MVSRGCHSVCFSLPRVMSYPSFEEGAPTQCCHCHELKLGIHVAVALSSMMPVLPLLDCLRDAGARVAPEVWHEITASCMLGRFPLPAPKKSVCHRR